MKDETSGLSMYLSGYPLWKAIGFSLKHFDFTGLTIFLKARKGSIQPDHIVKWGKRQHTLVIPYEEQILSRIKNWQRTLDCGCGVGYWGYEIRKNSLSEFIVGLDIHRKYLHIAKKLEVYDELILASATALPFRINVFHSMLAPELIEHLPKADGDKFLEQAGRIADRIVITTPAHYFKVTSAVQSEKHVSYWSEEELRNHGFCTEKDDEIIIAFFER
jgi:ubiquinone/menaquinone biosynthesis C-methylase UbiE